MGSIVRRSPIAASLAVHVAALGWLMLQRPHLGALADAPDRPVEMMFEAAWFRIRRFWVTQTRGNRRPVRVGFRLEGCLVREAAGLPGSGSLGLKRSQAQQGEPMRMAVAGHQLPRALALALGTPAA